MTHFLDDHCAYLSPNARSDCNKLDINEVIQHILISPSFFIQQNDFAIHPCCYTYRQ